MTDNTQIPKVGIAVLIRKEGKFLMAKRKGSHGEGTWSVPGGHLEYGESFEDTAEREVLEETGLHIKNISFVALTNDFFEEEGKHYVTIWMIADYDFGTLTICEPNKCEEQMWCTFDTLPAPLFLPWKQLLSSQFIGDIKKKLS